MVVSALMPEASGKDLRNHLEPAELVYFIPDHHYGASYSSLYQLLHQLNW